MCPVLLDHYSSSKTLHELGTENVASWEVQSSPAQTLSLSAVMKSCKLSVML
jgi:hypothetical protein